MIRRPPRSTRTDTLFPYTTLFRSTGRPAGSNRVYSHPLSIPLHRVQTYWDYTKHKQSLAPPIAPARSPGRGHPHAADRAPPPRTARVRRRSAGGDTDRDARRIPAAARARPPPRSVERRVGKECVSTWRYRGSPYNSKKNKKKN